MTPDFNSYLLPLGLFALSMAGSPGPNNLMLTASGANFGLRRSVPHMLGIILGMLMMLTAVAAGLGVVFEQWPLVHQLLRAAGAAFLFWMAWKIAFASSSLNKRQATGQPLTLWQAALFQFVNPKAWLINISSIATFSVAGADYWSSCAWIALVYALVMANTLPFWTSFGVVIGRLLSTPRALQRFNWGMGLATASSIVLIL